MTQNSPAYIVYILQLCLAVSYPKILPLVGKALLDYTSPVTDLDLTSMADEAVGNGNGMM